MELGSAFLNSLILISWEIDLDGVYLDGVELAPSKIPTSGNVDAKRMSALIDTVCPQTIYLYWIQLIVAHGLRASYPHTVLQTFHRVYHGKELQPVITYP